MKKKSDPRHIKRIKLMKKIYEKEFRKDLMVSKKSSLHTVLLNQKKIDKIITKNAPAWPLDQIASVDLATLRLAIWELKFKQDPAPQKAIIDEAVEIAKEYGSNSSPSFVNGVLGSIVKPKAGTKVKSRKIAELTKLNPAIIFLIAYSWKNFVYNFFFIIY